MRIVRVLPQAVGWTVEGCGEPLFFRTGSAAERAGRRLAAALVESCDQVELTISDLGGRLVGRLRLAIGAAPVTEAA